MRRALAIHLLPLALGLVLLAAPAGAAVSPPDLPLPLPEGTPAEFQAMIREEVAPRRSAAAVRPSFTLQAHGYKVGVLGVGPAVIFEVMRGKSKSITAYVARGTVTSRRIEASFGTLGRVEMRFRPAGGRNWIKPHRSCRGRSRIVKRPGVYVGVVRFRGEHDYLSLDARRAKGFVGHVAAKCERRGSGRSARRSINPSPSGPRGGDERLLGAGWRHAVHSAHFLAIGRGEKTHFLALTEQSEGKLATVRFAIGSGAAKAFTINNAVTSARVSPPPPFRGTGTYRAAPDGTTTWTGSLAVSFPGAEKFQLTGPPFEAAVFSTP